MIKATFKKHYFDYPMHTCFFCGKKPTGIITILKTREEVRCCESCFLLRKKGRKTRTIKGITNIEQESKILDNYIEEKKY